MEFRWKEAEVSFVFGCWTGVWFSQRWSVSTNQPAYTEFSALRALSSQPQPGPIYTMSCAAPQVSSVNGQHDRCAVMVWKVFSTCQWNKKSAPFNFFAYMKDSESHKWTTGYDTKQWGLGRAALPPALSITVSVLWGGAAFCSSSLSSWYEPRHSIQGAFWMV